MTPINLGAGEASDVSIVDGLVYVAYGVESPSSLELVVLTLEGVEVRRQTIDGGYFDSFPRFGGRWLAFKTGDPAYAAKVIDVVSGEVHQFVGQAEGDFGLAVNDALGVVAYQWGGYTIWFGSLFDGTAHNSTITGAPDGIDTVYALDHVTFRKDTRLSVPGIDYPVQAGDLTVGEWVTAPYGLGVQLLGDVLRAALVGQDCPTPRCATDSTHYALVTGGPQGVRVLIGTAADLAALPAVADIPAPLPTVSFGFTHPVLVRPFNAAGSGMPDLFTLGPYTEAAALPTLTPGVRELVAHDGQTDWVPPSGLRPFDLVLVEWYRVPEETIAQSAARWIRQTLAVLAAWPGDVGGIPMFYTQNRWTVADVYAALSYVSALVNLSPRLKVIAPFEYDRANGVTGVPELQPVFAALLAAGRVAGAATLTPITVTPPPDHHPPPSNPNPPIPVPPTETEMQLPARCYVLLHNSNIATVAPGQTAVDEAHAPEEEGGWQEIEVTKSSLWTPTTPFVLVRFVAANRLFRVDKVLAGQQKYDKAVLTWDPAAADADSSWQQGIAAGPYVHYLSDSPDGQRHNGVVYTLTCVDGNGQLFQ